MITLAVINEELAMRAHQDRIIVLEDKFKSGLDCTKCDGRGHNNETCPECKGTGKKRGKFDSECSTCTIGEGPMRKTLKFKPCAICKGQGTSSIVIPEDQQTRPTTGVVQSVGPLCGYIRNAGEWIEIPEEAKLKVGDRVLYHQHVGNIFQLGKVKDEIVIRYLRESEVLGTLHGVVKKTPSQGEFNELTEVGMKGL